MNAERNLANYACRTGKSINNLRWRGKCKNPNKNPGNKLCMVEWNCQDPGIYAQTDHQVRWVQVLSHGVSHNSGNQDELHVSFMV